MRVKVGIDTFDKLNTSSSNAVEQVAVVAVDRHVVGFAVAVAKKVEEVEGGGEDIRLEAKLGVAFLPKHLVDLPTKRWDRRENSKSCEW